MINLISFYYRDNFKYQRKDSLDHIKQSLFMHIDSLNQYEWNKESLIIKTNFDFEYKGIKSIPFQYDQHIHNLFFSKIIAAYEVLLAFPNEIVWQHDHDTLQLRKFPSDLSESLSHDITMCSRWEGNPDPNSASVFYRGMSKTLTDIYNYINIPNPLFLQKKYGDEDIFIHFRKAHYDIDTNLPFEYNTSLTKFSSRRRKSDAPFCVHGDPFRRRWDSRQYLKYKEGILKENNNKM
jgi:hypothetical protein